MYYSELVKGEKLENPIPPNRICKLERTYLSIKSYSNNQYNNINKSKLKYLNIHNTNNNNNNNSSSNQTNYWNNSEDILYIDKIGERFKVFHEVNDGEWLWAQSFKTNEYGILNADCVIQIVIFLIFF
jgi:hypothetical protein